MRLVSSWVVATIVPVTEHTGGPDKREAPTCGVQVVRPHAPPCEAYASGAPSPARYRHGC